MPLTPSTVAPPPSGAKERIWRTIEARIAAPVASLSTFDRLKHWLTPAAELQALVRARVLARLRLDPLDHAAYAPVFARVPRVLRWAAAFCITLLSFQGLLPVVLAPPTLAESQILLVPTRGQPTFLSNGFGEPIVREMALQRSAVLKTGKDSALTVIGYDDFVVRADRDTTLAVHDLADRPAAATYDHTLTLHSGRVWVLGLIPTTGRPVSIRTPQGVVLVRDGSVSIETGKDGAVTVRVWNRSAQVENDGLTVPLIAGERVDLQGGRVAFLKHIPPALYDESWAAGNLSSDGTHQREVAQLQWERHAAAAGILPTSSLYPVKRFAEEVNVLLTLSPDVRIQKRLDQANARLNEAAALLRAGEPDAKVALQEYHETMLSVAHGSGGSPLAKSLIEQQVTRASAELAAALPSDPVVYELKTAVLQTSASLPESPVTAEDVRGVVLLDTLTAFRQSIEQQGAGQDLADLREKFSAFTFDPTGLPSDVRKEAEASYALLAATLGDRPVEEDQQQSVRGALVARMTADQIRAYALSVRERVYVYDEARPRHNQLALELAAIADSPHRGSILRELRKALNQPALEHVVLREMEKLRSEVQYGSGRSL